MLVSWLFVWGIRYRNSIRLIHVKSNFPTSFVEESVFLQGVIFAHLSKIVVCRYVGQCLEFLFCPLVYMSIFVSIQFSFDYNSRIFMLKSGDVMSPTLFSLFKIMLAIWVSFVLMWILGLFFLVLWRLSLGFWSESHQICKLLWVPWTFWY